ncbi:hypothetical protein [Parvibacter caecicola]|uniref:Uncharacterized membrane protein YjfL (UPF0719 family) n=1 Tax=Parvibacter caecicola TaxID=747645 RepID=A0A7W5GPR6_9ACTN|nr:hypothetical protein [Parvibacter caecicola]MBB3171437.1 uncharacterized membrane protein YjfL (UPF0719 family) [Parvibacter caecicola]MCR2042257.1 hypothetical protein [Parvibacter caecicola]
MQMNKNRVEEEVERKNIAVNKVIDVAKLAVPVVAGAAMAAVKAVPRVVRLIKR